MVCRGPNYLVQYIAMHTTKKQLTPTKVHLTIAVEPDELARAKQQVLTELSKEVKLAGFRKGHAPAAMVEKVVDQQLLANRVIDQALNEAYAKAVTEEQLRPVDRPEVTLTKFVPFTELEMTATVAVVGDIRLPDYKKLHVAKKPVTVTDADVESVINDLLGRSATTTAVIRAAAEGDEVVINFAGVDAKTKAAIAGTSGEGQSLVLGSGAFIPGFEEALVGLAAGESKTFTVTFPKNYGATELQNKKVSFSVDVVTVNERVLPKLDAEFVAKLGPFGSAAELRRDIRKQIEAEKQRATQQQFENEVLELLGQKTQVEIPEVLVEQEIDRMDEEEKRNLVYRGQTWQEHLKAEGKTEEQHRDGHREQALLRIKIGLALGEVAKAEDVSVTNDEVQARIAELKKQYSDPQMQAELTKPENQQDIAGRLLTEKAIAVLAGYAGK